MYLPTTSFRISYRDQNPELAQKITSGLASLFLQQERFAREGQVYGTKEWLSDELAKAEADLKQSDTELKMLKAKNRYELPNELDSNQRYLDRLEMQRSSNLEALDRLLSMRMTYEQQISETPQTITRVAPPARGAAGSPAISALIEKYLKKEAEYKELLAKATPKYPDVQRLKAELDQLKRKFRRKIWLRL